MKITETDTEMQDGIEIKRNKGTTRKWGRSQNLGLSGLFENILFRTWGFDSLRPLPKGWRVTQNKLEHKGIKR